MGTGRVGKGLIRGLKMGARVAEKLETTERRKNVQKHSSRKAVGSKDTSGALSDATREELIIQNRSRARKLARSILRKWHSRLDLEEVDSIVDLSLCEAAQRFNPQIGAGFMTFLFYHLRGNLIRAVTIAATANTIPIAEVNMLSGNESDRDFSGRKGKSLMNAVEVAGALCGNEYVSPDEALSKKELIKISQNARENLDYLEKEVIERIYMNEEQLLDIAYDLGYSRCHISRIKRKALEALYNGMASLAGEDSLETRPNFEEEEEDLSARREIRRKMTTRRPRSRKAQKMHLEALRG